MSWFKRIKEGITTSTHEKKETPEGLWYKCPQCKHIVTAQDNVANLYVCDKCEYHQKVGSKEYFEIIFDNNEFFFICRFRPAVRSRALSTSHAGLRRFRERRSFSLAATPREIQRLVVNFYAPDCPPCEKEIPAIKKFYEKYRNNKAIGFFAIGSSLKAIEQNPKPGKDPPVSREQIRSELKQFSQKYASDWPQYLADGEDLRAWRITGFPETFLFVRVNDRWQLSRKIISEISFETLESFAAGGAAQENSVGSYR